LILAQGYEAKPIILYQDNEAAQLLLTRGYVPTERSRHIDIKYFWTTEQVEKGQIIIKPLRTDVMVADLCTKPLTGELFRRHCAAIMGKTAITVE